MDKPKTIRLYDNVVSLPRDHSNEVLWQEIYHNFKHGPATIKELKVMTGEFHHPGDGPSKTGNAAYILRVEGAAMPIELAQVEEAKTAKERKADKDKAAKQATKDEPMEETVRPVWWAALIDRRHIPNNGDGWLSVGLGISEDEVINKVKDWYDSHDWVVEGRPAHAR